MRESKVERPVCRVAEQELGVTQTKLVTPGDTGWPDRIFWLPGGRPFLIEFKAPGEEPTPLQQHRIGHLKKLGYDVEVHDDEDTALQAIRKRLEATALPKNRR